MPLRIAILGTRYSPPFIRGGEEAVIHELKGQFESRGHYVHVFTPEFAKWRDLDAASTGGQTTRLPVPDVPFLYHLEFARKLKGALADKQFDVVLNTHTALGCGLTYLPHVVIVATTSRGEARSLRISGPGKAAEYLARLAVPPLVEKRVYRAADRVVCVGEHIVDEVCDLYGMDRGRCVSIGNGVDCERFSPAPEAHRAKAQPPVLLYVGRLVSRKNVELLLDAAAVLQQRGKRFAVEVCGEGDQRDALERRSRAAGLAGIVTFLGRVDADALPDRYRRSTAIVVPSRYESLGPLVLFEAQACGLPAVVASYPSASQIVHHGQTGFVLEDNTPEELADYLARLLADEALCEQMGRHARERMIGHFSWGRAADRFLELFGTLREGGRGPGRPRRPARRPEPAAGADPLRVT